MQTKRLWEIDLFRGIAIVLMVIYHFFYDLDLLDIYSVDVDSGLWWVLGRMIAVIFIFLVGISLTMSYSRAKRLYSGFGLFFKYLKRGAGIFGLGLIITFFSWIFFREGTIIFGILHFIGIAIVLAYPFLRMRLANLVLGIGILIGGIYLQYFTFNFSYLIPFGFFPESFYSLDYFPILPWFGLVLIGIFVGNRYYMGSKRRFKLKDFSKNKCVKHLSFMGKHSLIIYFLHQPVLIGLLYCVKVVV